MAAQFFLSLYLALAYLKLLPELGLALPLQRKKLPDVMVADIDRLLYDQSLPVTETYILTSFMLIYGFLLELWVLNLNEKEEKEEKKKMKNSAHHSPIHL